MEANYDEAKIPHYTLPDPLITAAGEPVTTGDQWQAQRRPELLATFAEHLYGPIPATLPGAPRYEIEEQSQAALGGLATRRQVCIRWSERPDAPALHLLIYLPNHRPRPVPLFVGLNFYGNHTIAPDPQILLSQTWMRPEPDKGIIGNRSTVGTCGLASVAWPVLPIISRGYGVATMYCGDVDPDHDHGFTEGMHQLFEEAGIAHPGGTISTWAWGLSRALDYLEHDRDVNARRVAVIGHSRLGKAALWAGATDERFAMVISNNSGCGGAALFRRKFGETAAAITRSFPHWFCQRFNQYRGAEEQLPVDQHELLALIAPRPLYVGSASQDGWADPRGEFLSALHAGPVYELLGQTALPVTEMPEVHTPAHGTIGYHLRAGAHGLTPWDWEQYLTFADRHL